MLARATQFVSGSLLGILGRDRLLRNFGWLGLGEVVVRLSRIVTTIVLARYLTAVEFGVAATAITCFELIRILANNGLSQTVIRASDAELEATCNTAYRGILNICVVMGTIQIAVAAVIATISGRHELFWMIACLALVYAVMPSSMVRYWLLQRQYRMGTVAGILATQVTVDNLLTAGLAISGFGAWAIVLPKLLTSPIWVIGMLRAVPWRYTPNAGFAATRKTVQFCLPVLFSEIMVSVRSNVDNLLVGAILGLEALGIFYFAFNAGYGLSSVLTNALAAVSFRHLADPELPMQKLIARFDHAMLWLALPIGAIIILQSLVVPIYVPILFGHKWDTVITIVSVLCLSASTRSCYDLSAQLLRAAGLQFNELIASSLFTVTLLSAFALALPYGLSFGVTVLCIATVAMQVIFVIWARRRVIRHLADGASPASTEGVTPLASTGAEIGKH